jgi:hypothetical protein
MLPKRALQVLFHPIITPKEMPRVQAKSRAMSTRRRLAQICPIRLTSLMGLVKVLRNRAHISPASGSSSGRRICTTA